MKALTLTLVVMCGLTGVGRADEGIPAKTLKDLKRGTVFLRVKAGSNSGTGSGFLIRSEGTTGYIITNSHVVNLPGRAAGGKSTASIEAVFFSGSKEQASYQAELVSDVPDEDLALLRVTAQQLPSPLRLTTSEELAETMPVYCLGFPFGELLGINNTFPALTIGKGTVSSLRHNQDGDLMSVQIDGALNPGNSGGPVVDRHGNIIGVAVAAIRGAQIGMAVPAAEVAKLLSGRVLQPRLRLDKLDAGGAEVAVDVKLADPFRRIRTVSAHFVRTDAAKEKTSLGRTTPLAESTKVDLDVKERKAVGTLRLPDSKPGSYWLQIAYKSEEDKERRLAVVTLRVDGSGRVHLVERDIPDKLDHLKNGRLTVYFSVADAGLRTKVIEYIKSSVGNSLTAHSTFTADSEVRAVVFPVNDPRGFLERLQQVGKITRIYGPHIYFTPTDFDTIAGGIEAPPSKALPDKTATNPEPKVAAKASVIRPNPLDPSKGEKATDKGAQAVPAVPEKNAAKIKALQDEREKIAKRLTEINRELGQLLSGDWTLDVKQMTFPDTPAAGLLLGELFKLQKAKLLNTGLSLGGENSGIMIFLFLKPGQGIEGKSYEFGGEAAPNPVPQSRPHVHVHSGAKRTAYVTGYALRLEFGAATTDNKVPARIYLCLPDANKSTVAGTFMLDLD